MSLYLSILLSQKDFAFLFHGGNKLPYIILWILNDNYKTILVNKEYFLIIIDFLTKKNIR